MRTAAIRQELLNSSTDEMQRKRKIMALSVVGLVDFGLLALYQAGAIKRLPELPFKAFDSNKVNAAPEAYQMGAPDAAISAWLYATNLVLATYGGTEASGRKPVFDVLLGTAVTANLGGALFYLNDMTTRQKKICPYCLVGAAINIGSAFIMAPTFLKGLKKFFQ